MGFAYGLKFLKKGEEPDLTCAPTADAFNRTVEIPRVYDVAIPEIQLSPSRPVVDIGMHGFGSRQTFISNGATNDARIMYEQGYTVSKSEDQPAGAPNKVDVSPFSTGPSRKFQNDFCITVCKKDIYPAFKEDLKSNSVMYTYTDKTGNKEKSVLNINHRGWMRTCHKLQPVYSRYYR